MKILLSLIFTSTISMGVLANCEVYFNERAKQLQNDIESN